MASNGREYTPTQRKMMEVLSDGQRHRRIELHACLVDELGPLSNITAHISNLRKKLRPKGQDIICEFSSRVIYYRLVRLLGPPP